MSNIKDFQLRLAVGDETATLKNHYDEIVEVNNALHTQSGQLRHIDWIYPFPMDILEDAIDEKKLCVVEKTSEDPKIYASLIFVDTPHPLIWQERELPDDAIGFSKFGVSASLLGQGFGRSVAIPLIIDYAVKNSSSVLYCDALLNLRSFYGSLGFRRVGQAKFYWEPEDRTLLVDKHVLDLTPIGRNTSWLNPA